MLISYRDKKKKTEAKRKRRCKTGVWEFLANRICGLGILDLQ